MQTEVFDGASVVRSCRCLEPADGAVRSLAARSGQPASLRYLAGNFTAAASAY
jgi:hypothetical protein